MINAVSTARSLDWSGWLLGIWTSAISGGMGAVAGMLGPMLAEPTDFNLSNGLHRTLVSMAVAFALTGGFSLAKYLQMHPAPDELQSVLADAKAASVETSKKIDQAQAAVITGTGDGTKV